MQNFLFNSMLVTRSKFFRKIVLCPDYIWHVLAGCIRKLIFKGTAKSCLFRAAALWQMSCWLWCWVRAWIPSHLLLLCLTCDNINKRKRPISNHAKFEIQGLFILIVVKLILKKGQMLHSISFKSIGQF